MRVRLNTLFNSPQGIPQAVTHYSQAHILSYLELVERDLLNILFNLSLQ